MGFVLSTLKKTIDFIRENLISVTIILLLIAGLSMAVTQCSNARLQYRHNIEALNDTIKYYQDKNGNLVATKLAFESDINDLKLLNRNLYDQIDSLKLSENSVSQIIYVDGTIENQPLDTAYVILKDTVTKGFKKEFDFSDKYRELGGRITYENDSLTMNIDRDIVNFDYTLAIDKDSRMYVKSTNPYVKYNELSGFTLPKQHKKKWYVGPGVMLGYDPINRNASVSIGIAGGFALFSW